MTKVDWSKVQEDYCTGQKSLRDIAFAHGVSHTAIAKRAKNEGWIQDAPGTKRRIVAERMAGLHPGLQRKLETIENAAEEDARDMQDGLTVYRRILQRMVEISDQVDSPNEAKVVVEATTRAIDGIRRIRGLDEPGQTNITVVSPYEVARG